VSDTGGAGGQGRAIANHRRSGPAASRLAQTEPIEKLEFDSPMLARMVPAASSIGCRRRSGSDTRRDG